MPVGKNNVRANRYLSRDGLSPTTLPAAGTTPRELQMLQQSSATAAAAAAAAGGCATAHVSLASGGRKNKAPLPLDLARLPGIELLSKRECDLCTNCRLLPVHYLSIKEALMRASAAGQPLRRTDVRNMFKLEPVKAIRVYELLLTNGWVKDGGDGGGGGGGGGKRKRSDGDGGGGGGGGGGSGDGGRGGEEDRDDDGDAAEA